MDRWLWVTQPDTYIDEPSAFEGRPAWTCHKASQVGDVALLYRADLFKDFSHVFRVERYGLPFVSKP